MVIFNSKLETCGNKILLTQCHNRCMSSLVQFLKATKLLWSQRAPQKFQRGRSFAYIVMKRHLIKRHPYSIIKIFIRHCLDLAKHFKLEKVPKQNTPTQLSCDATIATIEIIRKPYLFGYKSLLFKNHPSIISRSN